MKLTVLLLLVDSRRCRWTHCTGSLAPGGPAFKSYKIEKDDALIKIDGTEISSMKPSQLGPLLQGARGSVVQLELIRYTDDNEIPFRVSLVRNWNMAQLNSNASG